MLMSIIALKPPFPFLFVNSGFGMMILMDSKDFLGKPFGHILSPEDAKILSARIQKVIVISGHLVSHSL